MRKRARGKLLIALGLVLLCAAGSMYALNERQDALAGQSARALLAELNYELRLNPSFTLAPEPSLEPPVPSQTPIQAPAETPPPSPEPIQTTLSGYDLLGVLSVPDVGVELPILSTWSYDLLKVAPCRYSGTLAGGDLILLGHKYKSHFAPLHKCEVGDSLSFTDAEGREWTYQIDQIDTLHKSETERLPSPGHQLTIFTCTPGGENRLVLRCLQENN